MDIERLESLRVGARGLMGTLFDAYDGNRRPSDWHTGVYRYNLDTRMLES